MYFFIIFLVAAYLLYKSSDLVIKYGLDLSDALNISTFALGFIFISVATSLPELSVAFFSGVWDVPGLSVGNVLGSNFTDLTLVLGLATIFGGTIFLKKKDILNLVELLFISSLVALFIFQRGELSVLHGILLLGLFGFLLVKLYKEGHISKKVFDDKKSKKKSKYLLFAKFALSIGLLLLSADFVVKSAIEIAHFFSLTSTLVGATLVALGTSLPELSVEIKAIKNRQYSLAMGDLFGSCVTNITLVLGVTSILSPVPINTESIISLMPFLMAAVVTIWYLLSKEGKITKYEGFILLVLYLLFIVERFLPSWI
ncbi:MAG: hypothetical protein DRO96_03445 [Candidatus Aenigmatarchaeota archaeon]|nr:MAG: hypothetical protein DRO96_03445 [Candidatus Aenigmarchaeota archaeon]